MTVRYVCISDLHLGARHSLLTNLNDDGSVDNDAPSSTLVGFAKILDSLLSTLPCDANTQLVLLGDVLDMGFSDMPDVIRTFRNFASACFSTPGFRRISQNILFMPGNHDHQIWEVVKDYLLLQQIEQNRGDKLLQVTKLLDPEHLESYLLRDIIHSLPGQQGITVQIAYPNLATVVGKRGLILHHGHYTESMYLTMSRLRMILTGELALKPDIQQIEKDNGYWINFLWSSLGSTNFGGTTFSLYETMLDPGGAHAFNMHVAKKLKQYLIDKFGASDASVTQINKSLTLDEVTRTLVEAALGGFSESERNSMLNVITRDSLQLLRWYLSGPVLNQFAAEGAAVPESVSFVFGHTHKPFEGQIPVAGYKYPVNVFNTGGWAIDSPVVAATQGAAVVCVDSDNNVASLRLFNCSPDSEVSAAYATDTCDPNYPDNPMLDVLKSALSDPRVDWAGFRNTVSSAVFFRAGLSLNRYFDPRSGTGFRKPGGQ